MPNTDFYCYTNCSATNLSSTQEINREALRMWLCSLIEALSSRSRLGGSARAGLAKVKVCGCGSANRTLRMRLCHEGPAALG